MSADTRDPVVENDPDFVAAYAIFAGLDPVRLGPGVWENVTEAWLEFEDYGEHRAARESVDDVTDEPGALAALEDHLLRVITRSQDLARTTQLTRVRELVLDARAVLEERRGSARDE